MKHKTPEAGEPQADAPADESRPAERPVPATLLQSTAAPRVKVLEGRGIALDHPDLEAGEALLMAALGTADRDFAGGILLQLGDAASYGGKVDEAALNFMLSVVKGVKPRDEVETMLAAQMASVHVATMTSARQLARATMLVQQDCAERAINKLARTFAAQTEALKRYRSGGEPNVTVRQLSVSDGGQAIVGNVTQASRTKARRAAPARAASAGATPAGTTTSRATGPRAPAPERPAIPPPAPADVPTTQPRRAWIAPAPARRPSR
jgi:hypothetical protein